MKDYVTSVLRGAIKLLWRERLSWIRGEMGQKTWFRPAEYPSLLLGIKRFEPLYARAWPGVVRSNECVIDVGANIGLTVQRFFSLTQSHGSVVAFEPSPRNFQLLTKNVSEIGSDSIRAFPFALGSSDGKVCFDENVDHGGLSRLAILDASKPKNPDFWTSSKSVEVEMRSLDSVLAENPDVKPTLVKVDVEGAAGIVFDGSRETLEKHKPFVNCSIHSEEEKLSASKILEEFGYAGADFCEERGWTRVPMVEASEYFIHSEDNRI